MKIIALNLPRDLAKEDLMGLFKKYGKIESCDLVVDKEKGTSKGFGFISMADETEANAAIAGLHGRKMGKNKIRVKASDQAE